MNITNIMAQFGEYLYFRLPKVYRDYDVEIERVVEGKVKVFKTLQEYLYSFAEGGFQPMLEDLEAIVNLVDPWKCPSEFLPLLLRHFGLDFIEDIPEKFQRRLLQNIVVLYKKKGTIPAVAFLARELSGFDVIIEETQRGNIEFALIKLNSYENEDAELLLAQDVVQRYIHLFLPTKSKAEIIVTYGYSEGIHFNSMAEYDDEYDHVKYTVTETLDELVKIAEGGDEKESYTLPKDDPLFGNRKRYGFWIEEFDLIQNTVEKDFNKIMYANGHFDESFNFSPFDVTSLTNILEEGDFVYTNGVCCEDTLISAKYTDTDSDGTIEFNYPSETGKATITKLTGSGDYGVMPMVKVESDILKDEWLRFSYDNKYYYWKSDRRICGSTSYPTTIVLYPKCGTIKIYGHYEKLVINELSDLVKNSGYDSFSFNLNLTVYTSSVKAEGCTISSSGYYNNGSADTTYVRVSKNRVDIARKDIKTVEAMRDWLKDNPITIYASATRDSYFGHYMEKYLETVIAPSSYRSFTMKESTDAKTAFSYGMNSLMRSTRVAITDKHGAEHIFRIPLELWSLNGKSNYISKSGGKYFMHYWVDTLPEDLMFDVNSGGHSGAESGHDYRSIFTIQVPDNPDRENYVHIPIDPSDSKNFACDIAPFIDTTLNYSGMTDIYDTRYFDFRLDGSGGYNTYYIACHNGFPIARPLFVDVSPDELPALEAEWKQLNKERWERFYEGTDIIPRFYCVRTEERVEEILDEEVINKLNLLPIPDYYAKIYSKDIPFSEIEVSVESKMYY